MVYWKIIKFKTKKIKLKLNLTQLKHKIVIKKYILENLININHLNNLNNLKHLENLENPDKLTMIIISTNNQNKVLFSRNHSKVPVIYKTITKHQKWFAIIGLNSYN